MASGIVTVTDDNGETNPLEFPKHLDAEFDRTNEMIQRNAYKLYWFVKKSARRGDQVARSIMNQMDMDEYYGSWENPKKSSRVKKANYASR